MVFEGMILNSGLCIYALFGQDGWSLAKFLSVEVNKVKTKKKVERGQYPIILTDQVWPKKDFVYGYMVQQNRDKGGNLVRPRNRTYVNKLVFLAKLPMNTQMNYAGVSCRDFMCTYLLLLKTARASKFDRWPRSLFQFLDLFSISKSM